MDFAKVSCDEFTIIQDGMAFTFKLVESKQMASGAVALVYEKAE